MTETTGARTLNPSGSHALWPAGSVLVSALGLGRKRAEVGCHGARAATPGWRAGRTVGVLMRKRGGEPQGSWEDAREAPLGALQAAQWERPRAHPAGADHEV